MWDQAMKAIDAYNNCVEIPDGDIVQDIINTSNVDAAKQIIKEFKLI